MPDIIDPTEKGCCGEITKEYTVWCYECSEWDQFAEGGGLARAKARWIGTGWRRVNGKWHCPDCVAKKGDKANG